MSVWKSGEILLIFASLISPSKISLIDKQYQPFDTVFHWAPGETPRSCQKYSLLNVSSGEETLRLMLDILQQQ